MARVELKIKASAGRVDVEQAKLDAFISDPAGPVVRDLQRRADNVMESARFECPIDDGGGVDGRLGGTLASTIRTEVDFSGRLPAVDVIAGREGLTPYTGYVLFGTKPHPIRPIPNRPNPHLRWLDLKSGQVIFSKGVKHPGTRAQPFLQRALVARAQD